MTSPTQLTLKELRKANFLAQVTERWNPFAKIRQDLFNFVDIVAIGEGMIFFIQCTSGSNHSARVKKIKALKEYDQIKRAPIEVQVWSWSKKGARGKRKTYVPRIENL